MNLPPPKSPFGYTSAEIDAILKARGIDRKVYGEACGVCTMRICPETGERLTPVIDVRRALDIVATGSSSIPWD